LNLLQKLKIKLDCSLKNSAGKKAVFFAQGAEAIEYTGMKDKEVLKREVRAILERIVEICRVMEK